MYRLSLPASARRLSGTGEGRHSGFDATDEQDLVSTGRCLFAGEAPQIMAGCAGFAAVLPRLLGLAGIPAEIPPAGSKAAGALRKCEPHYTASAG